MHFMYWHLDELSLCLCTDINLRLGEKNKNHKVIFEMLLLENIVFCVNIFVRVQELCCSLYSVYSCFFWWFSELI